MNWRVKICQMVAGEVVFIEHVLASFPAIVSHGGVEYLQMFTTKGEHYAYACEFVRAVGLCPTVHE